MPNQSIAEESRTKPLVSILIPAYNAGPWIAETLRSAIAQSWEFKEIIVVDDGSSDQTTQIARSFEDQGVRVFEQSNQGAAAARNHAFSLSKGEYIQWLDADDLLSSNKIEAQMEVLRQCADGRTLASGPWGRFLYRKERAQFVPTDLWCDLAPAEWLMRKMELNLHMQPATWLVSRELSEEIGPWDTTLAVDDDGEYFCRVLLASSGVRFVPEARVYYRATGSGSVSYIGNSERKRDAQWRSMRMHIDYLRSLEDSKRTRLASRAFLQNWLTFFYPERIDLVSEMQIKASELGGSLQLPKMGWKYAWIQSLFGIKAARRAQIFLPRLKWFALRSWDRFLYRLFGNSERTRKAITIAGR